MKELVTETGLGIVLGMGAAYLWTQQDIYRKQELLNLGMSKESKEVRGIDKIINIKAHLCVALGIVGLTLPRVVMVVYSQAGAAGQ